MAAGEVFPIINCADLERARRWYERVLSAAVEYQFPDEGDTDYLTLRIGGGLIGLGRGTEPAFYGETPLPASGHPVDICLYVQDLNRVTIAAAEDVVVPPTAMPWGETIAYLRDPQGTMLLVVQDRPQEG